MIIIIIKSPNGSESGKKKHSGVHCSLITTLFKHFIINGPKKKKSKTGYMNGPKKEKKKKKKY